MASTRVGFAGLGLMGARMASNLLKKGFPLTVWNRTAPRKLASLLEQQLARVTALIEELEGITRGESAVPPKLLWQARVGIDKTRDILRALPGYLSDSEREADPQPDIDRAVLERLYGCLD